MSPPLTGLTDRLEAAQNPYLAPVLGDHSLHQTLHGNLTAPQAELPVHDLDTRKSDSLVHPDHMV